MLYFSADGAKRAAKGGDAVEAGYAGGIATAVNFSRKTVTDGPAATTGATDKASPVQVPAGEAASLAHCLHPYDLVPFSRKPLFLIVDSTNSVAFKVLELLIAEHAKSI